MSEFFSYFVDGIFNPLLQIYISLPEVARMGISAIVSLAFVGLAIKSIRRLS